MFESKTLFIVGAGASSEIGLPVGSKLIKIIAEKLKISFRDGRALATGDGRIVDALRWYAQSRRENSSLYFQKGRLVQEAMPVAPSIDNFLDAHKNDPQLQICGKVGIAASILEAERGSLL